MTYTTAMMSNDPRVIEAIPERMSLFRSALEEVQAWARAKGGDGVVGSTRYGVFRVAAITATARPQGRWRRYPLPIGASRGTLAFVPLEGSPEHREMESAAVSLLPIPGMPMWIEGRHMGRTIMRTPAFFVHEGVAYCNMGCEPFAAQPAEPRGEAGWISIPLADMKAAEAAASSERSRAADAS